MKLKLRVVEKYVNRKGDSDESCLAVSAVCIHGVELYALLDTGTTPNVMTP